MDLSRAPRLFLWALATAVLTIYTAGVYFFSSESISASIIVHTLGLGLASWLFAFALSLPLALALASTHFSRLSFVILVIASSIPLYLQVAAWDSLFGKLGWLTSLVDQPLKQMPGRWLAAIWVHGMAAFPQVTFLLLVGLRSGAGHYEDQGHLEAGPWIVFWKVTLYRIRPFIFATLLWVLLICSREIAVTDIYQIGTLAEHIYLGYAMGQSDQMFAIWPNQSTSLGLEVPILTIAWLVVGCASAMNWWNQTEIELNHDSRMKRSRFLLQGIAVSLLILAFGIPISSLMIRGAMSVQMVNEEAIQVFQYSTLQMAISDVVQTFRPEFFWSTTIAGVSTAVIIFLSLASLAMSYRIRFLKILFWVSVALTFCLPGPIIGTMIATISAEVKTPILTWLFDRTIFGPVVATSLFVWPIGAVLIWLVVGRNQQSIWEQAAVDGANGFRQFWSMCVASNARSIGGMSLLIFVFSFGELSASQLIVPAGMDTVPRLTLGFLHSGVDEKTAALCFLTLVWIGILASIASLLIVPAPKNKRTRF
ncbi:MAG: hypothetical protein R3C03_00270 [Pirellulaceae bacterium]